MARTLIAGWVDQDAVLSHGTLDVHAAAILTAVDVTVGGHLKDFGRGFYTTTSRVQAEQWAMSKAVNGPHNPAVISITVPRNDLALLESLFFVRGDPAAIDYWAFVHHCRTTTGDHRRRHSPWYDLVAGPVSGSWRKLDNGPGRRPDLVPHRRGRGGIEQEPEGPRVMIRSDVVPEVDQRHYWGVVRRCLVEFHQFPAAAARGKVRRFQTGVEKLPLAAAEHFFHAEPFDVACRIAERALDVSSVLPRYLAIRDGSTDAPA